MKNEFPIELVDTLEAPFEIQYFVRNKETPDRQPLWWKVNKHEVNGAADTAVGEYLSVAPEDIMLLNDKYSNIWKDLFYPSAEGYCYSPMFLPFGGKAADVMWDEIWKCGKTVYKDI